MGRELKRVPLDFDYPIGEIWKGYEHKYAPDDRKQERCLVHERELQPEGYWACKLLEPPTGEGFQLWETTSEGSPMTPVFETFDELCRYAENNCTTFGSFTASAEEWGRMLTDGLVGHWEGRIFFC